MQPAAEGIGVARIDLDRNCLNQSAGAACLASGAPDARESAIGQSELGADEPNLHSKSSIGLKF